MSPLLPNPERRSNWQHKVLLTITPVAINLGLALLMYWLTLGQQHTKPMPVITLATVFEARTHAPKPDQPEPELNVSQAPQSSQPPPPMTVNFSVIDQSSLVTINDVKVPITHEQPKLQLPTMTFSPDGDGNGSVLTGAVTQAKPVFQLPPQYPARAKQRGIEGHVVLGLKINADGRVDELRVIEEEPLNVFSQSARRAVVRWRFAAPERPQWQQLTITYELEN